MRVFHHFLNDESAATAIEYALIVALIGIPLIAIAKTVSMELQSTFEVIADAMKDARTSAGFR